MRCGAPGNPVQVPVTLDWIVSTGRNDPLLATTWDLVGSGVLVDRLNDDSRAPYGELLFGGAASDRRVGWGGATSSRPPTTP